MVIASSQVFLTKLPKAELHVHIEGTLEPEMLVHFAQRNKVKVPSHILNESHTNYIFTDFKSFINTYLHATAVLCTEQDYSDLVVAYFKKVSAQGVMHAEIFFDIQSHVLRGIEPKTVINGLNAGLMIAQKMWGVSGGFIMCFLRHLSEDDALQALQECLPYKDKILAFGLASLEDGNSALKFEKVFAMARAHGFHVVAHAGESDIHNIIPSIERLKVERIDHGIQCAQSPYVMNFLAERKIPLTVCPLSNVALRIIENLKVHPIKKMIDAGIVVTVNSDDPAFFGGYIAENYNVAVAQCHLSMEDIVQCARNSFTASFASQERKKECLDILSTYIHQHRLP